MTDASGDVVEAVAAELREADTAVVLTGAGVSAPSGIPTFRGEDGIWETQFDPDDFHVSRFRADPAGFWRDRLDLHEAMVPDDVAPNPAHEALADLERAGHLDAVVTQNTDGLHQQAGSDRVLEVHGSGERVECQACGAKEMAEPVRRRVEAAVETGADGSDGDRGELPPTCPECGGVLKPDVVLFGEALPRVTFAEARHLAGESDVLLAAGSSLTVHPAASLAQETRGSLVVVNAEKTAADRRADHVLRGNVATLLPAIRDRVVD